MLNRRSLMLGTAGLALAAPAVRAQARPIRIGVLGDMSTWGRDNSGPGATWAVQQAVKDMGGTAAGRPVEVLQGDHKMVPDLGLQIARQWFDEGVDAVTDLTNSAVALAISALAAERDRIALNSGAGSSDMTNAKCNARTVCFTYDTYALAKVVTAALGKQGVKTWYFIGADYAYGKQLIADATAFIQASGGRVLGTSLHPSGATDFSAFLLQAQASGADAIAVANTGTDCTNVLKQAREFGISSGKQRLATLSMFDTDVAAAGLEVAGGALMVTSAWDTMSPETLKWTEGYRAAVGTIPTMLHFGDYGAVTHYLKAVGAASTTDAGAVMAKMQALPIQDIFCRNGTLRKDGRVMRDMFLMRVKAPAQAKLPFDYLELVETVPAEQAFRPAADSSCSLLRA